MKRISLISAAGAVAAIALAGLIAGCGSGYGGGGNGGAGCGIYGTCPTNPPAGPVDCSSLAAGPNVTVDLNLSLATCNDKTYANVLGFSLDNAHSQVVKIPVGSNVQFMASVGYPHTADLLGTAGFPGSDTNPATASAAGADISSANFSTGALNSNGAMSAVYKANVVGIYYFGCHFHYMSNNMRTVVIVQ